MDSVDVEGIGETEGSFADELELYHKQCDSNGNDDDDVWHGGESLWDGLGVEVIRGCENSWTNGHYEGLLARYQEYQEWKDIGFKESVSVGSNWGFVRGITSALACLPNGLRERLVETQEKRDKFQDLYESVHSLALTDVLKLFNDDDDDAENISAEQSNNAESSSQTAYVFRQTSDFKNYYEELHSFFLVSPAVQEQLEMHP